MRKTMTLAALVLLFAAPAVAQQAKMTTAEKAQIKADVTAAVETYTRLLHQGDPKAVIDNVFAQPSFGIGANGVAANDPARQIAGFGAVMKRRAEEGWVKSTFKPIPVCILTRNSALSGGNLYRAKAGAADELVGSETILFGRTPAGWKIVSVFVHEEENQTVKCPD